MDTTYSTEKKSFPKKAELKATEELVAKKTSLDSNLENIHVDKNKYEKKNSKSSILGDIPIDLCTKKTCMCVKLH